MVLNGVSRKLVEEADCGIYVEPENPQDFAEKIRFYLKNRDLIEKQGKNGYKFAKKYFNRTILALKYLEAIQSKIN